MKKVIGIILAILGGGFTGFILFVANKWNDFPPEVIPYFIGGIVALVAGILLIVSSKKGFAKRNVTSQANVPASTEEKVPENIDSAEHQAFSDQNNIVDSNTVKESVQKKNGISKKLLIVIGIVVVAVVAILIINPFGGASNGDYYYVYDNVYANSDKLSGDSMDSSKVSMEISGSNITLYYYGSTYKGTLTKKSDKQGFEYLYDVSWDTLPNLIDLAGADYCGTSLLKGDDYPKLQFTYTWSNTAAELTTGNSTFTTIIQTIAFDKN